MRQWIKITLIPLPYYNGKGSMLATIAGRKNRPNLDQFTGGGYVYPNMNGLKVLSWQEAEEAPLLMVLVEADQKIIEAFLKRDAAVTYQDTPSITKTIRSSDFKPTAVDPKDVVGVLIREIGLSPETKLSETLEPIFPAVQE